MEFLSSGSKQVFLQEDKTCPTIQRGDLLATPATPCVTSRSSLVPWLASSPNLSCMHFFSWNHMKNLVYETLVPSIEDIIARISVAAGMIARNYLPMGPYIPMGFRVASVPPPPHRPCFGYRGEPALTDEGTELLNRILGNVYDIHPKEPKGLVKEKTRKTSQTPKEISGAEYMPIEDSDHEASASTIGQTFSVGERSVKHAVQSSRRKFSESKGSCQVIYSQFGLAIHQNDHQARRRFVEWAQNEIAVVPDFHKRILFSDEAHFWLNGYVNKQNCRIWSEANPQVYVETPLHPEKLTVWCALWAGGILLQKR
ncbi:hypothetical protein TNCV_517901 [Trichonephila clavipes]|nr:hypothetical protein TNCV_517901 [Trichonephila clavipes]